MRANRNRFQVVIRIRCDAEVAQCQLGMKFGCDPVYEAPNLLHSANKLGLNIAGVSFHVGSGCQDPPVYRRALRYCKDLFDLAIDLGFKPYLVDIGGGFPGDKGTSIDKFADVINSALDEYFNSKFICPSRQNSSEIAFQWFFNSKCLDNICLTKMSFAADDVQIIAEPGRFYVASAFTLATSIHSKRSVRSASNSPNDITCNMYYINDGVYGSFNCLLYDHQHVTPIPLKVCTKEIRNVT